MMETTLKPYPEYCQSGLPWIGDIPEHWDLVPNRAFLHQKKETVGTDSARYTLLSLTLAGVIPRDLENAKGKFPASFDAYQAVRPGDLVFCFFDIDETPRTVGLVREAGMLTGAYTAFSCDDRSMRGYLHRLYLHLDDHKALRALYTGLRKVIKKPTFLGVKSPVPPMAERVQIVRFLAYTDHHFKRLIRTKRRLIALLNEQKQAIIQRAVTRGLDPDVPLKSSGIDWLGEVPEHWKEYRLKHLFREIDRRSGSGKETLLSLRMREGLVPHEDVSDKPIAADALIGYKLVEPGQLVMNRMRAASGLFGLAHSAGLVSPDYAIFEVASEADAAFFRLLFRTPLYRSVFFRESKGLGTGAAGFARLYTDRFGALSVFIPSAEEQRVLRRAISQQTSTLNDAINQAENEVDLIREYRARLIADVVTGKLDVRGVAVPELEGDETIADLDVADGGEHFIDEEARAHADD